jgi:hypothetical protein
VWPHLTPPELNQMELWEIAVLLGLDEHVGHFQLPKTPPPVPQPAQGGDVGSPARRLRAVM